MEPGSGTTEIIWDTDMEQLKNQETRQMQDFD